MAVGFCNKGYLMDKLIERFLRYVSFDTQSNGAVCSCPSTPGQRVLAEILQSEMVELGLSDICLDHHGYLTARLPANMDGDIPAIGFIAHMDTALMHQVKMFAHSWLKTTAVVILL